MALDGGLRSDVAGRVEHTGCNPETCSAGEKGRTWSDGDACQRAASRAIQAPTSAIEVTLPAVVPPASETASSSRPHDREPDGAPLATLQPAPAPRWTRSASSPMPPAEAACTSESGAIASAAT